MAATPGYRITLTNTDGTNTTTIGKILSISYDGPEANVIDTTTFSDTWRTAIAGMKNARSARIRVQYDKTEYNTTIGILGTERTWTFNSGDATASASNLKIAGFLAGGPSFVGEMNGQIESEITLQFSGAPTHSTN